MNEKSEKKAAKTPLQKYRAAHSDKPCFFLGKKADIKDESLEDLNELVDAVWQEIAHMNQRTPRFFLSHNEPSYLSLRQQADIKPLTPQNLKSLLNELVYLYFCTKSLQDDGTVKTEYRTRTAPGFFLTQMLTNPIYVNPLPELERIVYAPYYTEQFQLHHTPGYNPHSKTYYHLTDSRLQDLHIPAKPSAAQVTAAKHLILNDVLVDFPFSGEAERANAISTLLEPFIRSWFYVTPFRLIESARAGTGKGLLVDTLLYPFLGKMPTRLQEARNPDEWQKLLMSILLSLPAVVFFDNIKKPVNDGSLESILTDKTWGRRLLGSNEQPVLENHATWIFAGNNVKIGEEIARRTIRIRMVAKCANPHQRTAFRHHPQRDWLIAQRKNIVEAVLLLIQNWIAQGRPVYEDTPVLGSYEDWARIMHGILKCNEIPGFLGNMQEMIDLDKYDEDDINELLQLLWQTCGEQPFKTSEVYALLQANEDLPVNLGAGDERSKKTKLGNILMSNRERAFIIAEDTMQGDLPVTVNLQVWLTVSGSKNNAKLWRLTKLTERWTATLTEAKSHQLYQLWADEAKNRLNNKQIVPDEPEIKLIEEAPKNEHPF